MEIGKPKEEENIVIERKECPNSGKYIALIILFAIVAGVGWVLYYTESQRSAETIVKLESTSDEKEKVTSELNDMLVQYDELMTSNDTLNDKLVEERAKIQGLLDEVKKVKSASYWQINKYKKELGTLRQIMKGYIYQIDSLNTLNVALQEENLTVKNNYTEVKDKNKELEDKNSDLLETVDVAKTLRAMKVNTTPINEKGKLKLKAKKVEKIKVCFTLAQNKVVEAGQKSIYIRITDPSNKILGSEKILVGDEEITCSAKRLIQYDNRDLEVCVFWTKDREIPVGIYKVEIYERGKLIGNSSFELK
jgi:uncharacterized coiled-coil protein SlyX